jgi:hypothetical protein
MRLRITGTVKPERAPTQITRSLPYLASAPALALASFAAATALASFARPALAEPPPTDFDKVTAPMPPEGRRGKVPAPRLPDRMLPSAQTEPGAGELGLLRQDDGSYLYLDPGRRFTARVELDGRIVFADRWRRPVAGSPERGACCGRPPEGTAPAGNPFWGAPVRGPAEWISRSLGRDPAASAKAQLLEKTREFRVRLAVAWGLELVATRLAALEGELETIWNADALTLEHKRRLLFARWDECAERFSVPTDELPPDAIVRIDEARLEAATVARTRIAAFVREHAPHGTPEAYSATELERLNASRVSVRPFAPYGTVSAAAPHHRKNDP